MYQETVSRFQHFNSPFASSIALGMIQCLDLETLKNLYTAVKVNQNFKNFAKLILTQLYLKQYVHHVDRSLYLIDYDTIDIQTLDVYRFFNLLASSQQQQLIRIITKSDQLKIKLQQQCSLSGQQIQQIQNIFTNPDLPLPRCKRYNIAQFCQTPIQIYFAMKYHEQSEQEQEDYLYLSQAVKERIIENEDKYIRQFISIKAKRDEKQFKKILNLLQEESLDFGNTFLVDNELHNLIVILQEFMKNHIEGTLIYLKSIHDPLELLVELVFRYTVFRNIILSIEENFGFLFKTYQGILEDVFQLQNAQFSFIQFANNSWRTSMAQQHQKVNQVYAELFLLKSRKNMKSLVEDLTAAGSESKKKMLMNEVLQRLEEMPNELSQNQHGIISEYLDHHDQLYQLYMTQYVDILVDLSVNESSANWCGHSEQNLAKFYQIFQSSQIEQIVEDFPTFAALLRHLNPLQRQEIAEKYFDYAEKLGLKPTSIKKLVMNLTKEIRKEQAQHEIYFNFSKRDFLLENVNKKISKLQNNCDSLISINWSRRDSEQYEYKSESETEGDEFEMEFCKKGSKKIKLA